MKRFYLLVSALLLTGGVIYSQTDSWSDNFDDNSLDELHWNANPGLYDLNEANGELEITVAKGGPWDGMFLSFPGTLDLSEHPYASIRIKADTAVDFRLYLWDESETDTLYNKAMADVWVVPGDEYNTYYFNWRGKFKHSDLDENNDEVLTDLDSTSIDGILINADPGGEYHLYQGTLVFDDFKVGAAAELSTAEVAITGSTIGAVGATVVSDIPEGTTVDELLSGLIHNGDKLIMYAAGEPGMAGVEASGSDELDKSMNLVVYLAGGNPRKYNILVAPPALACYYREDFPLVDAEIDAVWETVPVVDLPYLIEGAIGGGTDFGATFRVLWDEVSLFILAEITDDLEMVDSPVDPYQDDCVEFWLDLNNSKNTSYLPSETDEFQFMFPKGGNTFRVDKHDHVDGMTWAWANSQGGYIFEIEIPWLTTLEWLDRFGANTPDVGHKIGFDIHVNDDDDGGDRDAAISWFDIENMAWTDPSVLGDLQLKEESTESVQGSGSNLKFRIYPNPASETMQLISNQGISYIEVINLTGQCVMTQHINHERLVDLDITSLASSLYLVTVREMNGKSSTRKFIKK